MTFQEMIDYVLDNYPELDMTQDFTFYFDVDEYMFEDKSKQRPVMHIFIDFDWTDQWGDNLGSIYFIDTTKLNFEYRAIFKAKPGGDSIRETEIIDLDETTLKNLLELTMQDKRKLEKKAKKEFIDATAKRYDA